MIVFYIYETGWSRSLLQKYLFSGSMGVLGPEKAVPVPKKPRFSYQKKAFPVLNKCLQNMGRTRNIPEYLCWLPDSLDDGIYIGRGQTVDV